ncbi:hypothetical protein ACX0MV_09155 [Pseudomonas borbori]
MRLEPATLLERLNSGIQRHQRAARGEETDPQEVRDGLRVSLSELGKARSANAKGDDAVEESDLPPSVQQALKMIRELKAKIAAKQEELKAVMADRSLSTEARQTKSAELQSELTTLNGALAMANASLLKLMRESGLTPEQMQLAGRLALG